MSFIDGLLVGILLMLAVWCRGSHQVNACDCDPCAARKLALA